MLGVGRKVGSRNGSRGCCATINTPRDATRHVFLSSSRFPPPTLSFPPLFLFLSLSRPVCLPLFSLSRALLVLSFSVSIIVCLYRVLLRFSTGRSRFHARFATLSCNPPLLHPLSHRPQPPSSPSLVSFVSLGSFLCPVFLLCILLSLSLFRFLSRVCPLKPRSFFFLIVAARFPFLSSFVKGWIEEGGEVPFSFSLQSI